MKEGKSMATKMSAVVIVFVVLTVLLCFFFSIRNTKGYLGTNEKHLVEREKLMIKATINNTAR